jgi:4-oxalocrotonate tautomerase
VARNGDGTANHDNRKEQTMPLVSIRVIENVFTPEEKEAMLKNVTEALVAVEGEAVRPYTVVSIEEVHSRDYAVGGQPLATADVQALRNSTSVRAS